MNTEITMSERNDCKSEMPAALIAVSSLVSPKFPKLISADNKIARGRDCGTSIKPMYQKNWANISIESPLPIKSSM